MPSKKKIKLVRKTHKYEHALYTHYTHTHTQSERERGREGQHTYTDEDANTHADEAEHGSTVSIAGTSGEAVGGERGFGNEDCKDRAKDRERKESDERGRVGLD